MTPVNELTQKEALERKLWRTDDGRVIPVEELTERHLLACLKCIAREWDEYTWVEQELAARWRDTLEEEARRRNIDPTHYPREFYATLGVAASDSKALRLLREMSEPFRSYPLQWIMLRECWEIRDHAGNMVSRGKTPLEAVLEAKAVIEQETQDTTGAKHE